MTLANSRMPRSLLIGCCLLLVLFCALIGRHGVDAAKIKNIADAEDYNDADTDPETADCLKKHPDHVKKRFDKRMLKKQCEKKKSWTTSALQNVGKTLMSLLSPAQQDYFVQVSSCDLFCLCKKVPLCKWVQDAWNNKGDIVGSTWNMVNDPNKLGNMIQNGINQFNEGVSNVKDWFKSLGRRRRDLGSGVKVAVRKEYRMLTDDERNKFHAALNRLKFTKIDDKSKYDILTMYHTAAYSPGAHFGPSLLPFHREWLRNLELGLRLEDPDVALPYWDSTLDDGLPNAADSIMWTEAFLGNNNGPVTTGFMANWTVLPNPNYVLSKQDGKVVRACGQSTYGTMYKPQDIDWVLSRDVFKKLTYCVDPFFELLHGGVHMWVGGHMAELEISPNDPSFFLHHTFVDYIFEGWRQTKQANRTLREITWTDTAAEYCNSYHDPQAQMKPFAIRNIGGLANNYTDKFYVYAPRPSCNETSPDCGSKYLWCDKAAWRCHVKIKIGGNCTGFVGSDICMDSVCKDNKCLPTVMPDQTTHTTIPPTTTTAAPTASGAPVTTTVSTTAAVPSSTVSTKAPPNLDTVDSVWFPITVLQESEDGNAAPLTAAIISFLPAGATKKFPGELGSSADTEYPHFPGEAYVQVPNPAIFPNGHVTGNLAIGTPDGQTCQALCYQDPAANNGVSYTNCDGTVDIDVDTTKTGNLTYTPAKDRVPYISWSGPIRKPTRYLFICPKPSATVVTNNTVIDTIINATTNGTQNTGNEVDESCLNKHRCCPYWSSFGECQRNYIWMGTSCEKSCQICGTTEKSTVCKDFFSECAAWATDNQCQANQNWMEENCQKSCNTCGRTADTLAPLCGGHEKTAECKDWYGDDCIPWSQSGECTKNEWWMNENCPLSCGACTPTKPTTPTST